MLCPTSTEDALVAAMQLYNETGDKGALLDNLSAIV